MNFTDFRCNQPFHTFARSGEDGSEINAYHGDESLCTSAEFNLAELLEDDLPRAIECPWCLKTVLDTEHVRRCSNYKPAPTREEVLDAYSHPTDRAKRDSLLRDMEG